MYRGGLDNGEGGNSGDGNNSTDWTEWSQWSACSKTCDQGVQLRNKTCLSPLCIDDESQESKDCNSTDCPDSSDSALDPPSNITTANSTSSSSIIQWNSYNGNATLLAYRVVIQKMGPRANRKKREISQLGGELIRNFTVGPNITAVEIGNLSVFTRYCFQIRAITKEYGEGRRSDCFYFYTEEVYTKEEDETSLPPPKSSAHSDGLSSVKVQWEPLADAPEGLIRGYTVFLRETNRTIIHGLCMKNTTVASTGCIEVAAITMAGWGNTTGCLLIEKQYSRNSSVFDPPSNITTVNSTSSSSVIQWSSYNGNGTLLAYRVLVKNLGPRVNRKKREISQLEGNFIRNFTVGPNITAVEIGNLSTFFKYCFQILVITKEYGYGRLSDCFYFYTRKTVTTVAAPLNETAPKISASIRKSLTTIQVKWDPKTITGVKLGHIIGFQLVYELVKVNGKPSDNSARTRINFGSNYTEYLLTDLSPSRNTRSKWRPSPQRGLETSAMLFMETCACAEYITVPSSPNIQDSNLDSIASQLTKVISKLLIDICGECEEYNKTKIIYSNKSRADEFVFPITKTSYGRSAYSKFIPVIRVPGVVVVTRKGDLSMVLTKVASGSILQSWPISVVTILLAMLAGIIIWFLVAVVADSPEKRVALGTLSGKLNVGKTFPDVKHLVEALKDGVVDSILVDMYIPVKRKDLFNGSWFEIAKLLEVEISQGVLLQGKAVGLAEELEKIIIAKDVQTGYLQGGSNDQEHEEEDVEEEPVTFFEPSSPYYLTTMYVTVAALAVCLCCGLLYQAFCYKKTRSGPDNGINQNAVAPDNTKVRADMEAAVKEFYKSFSVTYEELRRKCKAELIQLAKLKRQVGKSLISNNTAWESDA
ncbi:hypothetical protein OS493_030877 [Desmophyllum pertusum]|uniref:Fibronectin type-III domain-containing protein n=1 Tax=Desmophyllum pertusum TaxID=174260 RepID=A0A9W9Y8Z0_9CNID|nr:hypothetical protein OS493_030877 [Desmophyllum pertusum]